MLAGSLGLSLTIAMRYHGLAGRGPQTSVGPRHVLLAHMAHTLGADGVFATFARAARLRGDGSLLEWRNAAACARGRSRPDGLACCRWGAASTGSFSSSIVARFTRLL
jgi:hypothetical protein